MFGLTKALENVAKSLHSFSDNLNKFNEELPKKLLNSALREKTELISYMKLSEREVDEILFSVRNSSEYKCRDELYKQQSEVYHLRMYRELYDMAKQQGLTVKELEAEVERTLKLFE